MCKAWFCHPSLRWVEPYHGSSPMDFNRITCGSEVLLNRNKGIESDQERIKIWDIILKRCWASIIPINFNGSCRDSAPSEIRLLQCLGKLKCRKFSVKLFQVYQSYFDAWISTHLYTMIGKDPSHIWYKSNIQWCIWHIWVVTKLLYIQKLKGLFNV